MSRLSSGHRKSQSTSALSIMAQDRATSSKHQIATTSNSSSSSSASSSRLALAQSISRPSDNAQHGQDDPSTRRRDKRNSVQLTPSLAGVSETGESTANRSPNLVPEQESPGGQTESVKAWLRDIRSLRSSERRRLAALRNLERTLVSCCTGAAQMSLVQLSTLDIHSALLGLLSRHAQSLSQKAATSHSTLSPHDALALVLLPELTCVVLILQGLCLVDRRAKEESGEKWVLELLIDLLLVLRAQTSTEPEKAIDYCILDLLCCILVDSSRNARAFEELNGLEGVVRVLKGTSAAKEVKMKCIEFLYFYLLPEDSPDKRQQRAVSSSSSSSSSSTGSQLFPPTPTSDDLDDFALSAESSHPSSPYLVRSGQSVNPQYEDLDMNFVPQTPHKRPQPSLGFHTPSTRRVSGAGSSTPSLMAIPPSPRSVPPSPSSKRLASMAEDDESIMLSPGPSDQSRHSGLRSNPPTPSSRRRQSTTPQDMIRSDDERAANAGLGLGIPHVTTSGGLGRSSSKRDMTAIHLGTPKGQVQSNSQPTTPTFSDPFRATSTASGSSSGSSTVVPTSRGISRSSTLPSLTVSPDPSDISADEVSTKERRRSSIRSVSKSSMLTTITDSPERISKSRLSSNVRHSGTESNLCAMANGFRGVSRSAPTSSASASENEHESRSHSRSSSRPRPMSLAVDAPANGILTDIDDSRSPRPRQSHSRTQSHMSGLPTPPSGRPSTSMSMPPPPVPVSRRSSLTPPVPTSSSHPLSRQSSSATVAAGNTSASSSSVTSPATAASVTGGRNTSSSTPLSKFTPTPAPNRRAFPAELTKGLPSAASSPNLTPLSAGTGVGAGSHSPLMASKRVSSGERPQAGSGIDSGLELNDKKGQPGEEGIKTGKRTEQAVKSVEEKKKLLGMWLGNVDQLVQGVEKVSFWGSVGKR